MPGTNQIKLTIGGPEISPGTAATMEYVIPLRAVSDLDKSAEKAEDPAILGRNMASGEYLTGEDVAGGIPLTPRPCGGLGVLIKSCLGKEKPPMQVAACIRLRYQGPDTSCKIETHDVENRLVSNTGNKESEVPDANFGTGGTIDFTGTDFDTLNKVVTAINGYTDYECDKVFGDDAEDLTGSRIEASITIQGKGMWAYLWFISTTSGIYRHTFYYDTGIDELPTYSIQKDGYMDNYLYSGCVVNTLRLSAALKGFVEGEVDILGFSEMPGQTASGLALEDIDPLIFHNGSFSLGGKDYRFVRSLDLELNNNHNAEGYGQGSAARQYHQKGKFESSGNCSIRMDADSHGEREKVFSDELVSCSFLFKGKNITVHIPELMVVDVPYCSVSSFEYEENSGVFDSGIGFKVLYPKGIIYNNPVQISILTRDAAEY